MRVPKWLLPTLSEILALSDPTWTAQEALPTGEPTRRSTSRVALQRLRAEREWRGAIAALTDMLQSQLDSTDSLQGVVLAGPLPVLSQPELMKRLSTWTLTVSGLEGGWNPFRLLPAVEKPRAIVPDSTPVLPLLPGDPLAAEQFCLVLTPTLSLVMVLGEDLLGAPAFMFSFMPDVVERAWDAIRPRILLLSGHQMDRLDALSQQFAPVAPDYQTVMQFSRRMLQHLPDGLTETDTEWQESSKRSKAAPPAVAAPMAHYAAMADECAPDVELLQAIAHEVRTPLSTIRTLTRLLLKRKDLPPDVLKRLDVIDRECSEQIDRFGLFFRAVELETTAKQQSMSLTRTSLAQVLDQSIPRWKQQATQRSLTLDVSVPQTMPTVVSDPSMLDQALTSLIERFTRSLPAGSHIQVEVTQAGEQLKLQLQSQPDDQHTGNRFADRAWRPSLRSIGQLLMFQPETGSLSLNLAVTKNLFQALGGKLIVRQKPEQGEVMTVYLPLEVSRPPFDVGSATVLEV